MEELKNKNILIILPYFFEYEKIISDALKKLGSNVYTINENIKNSSIMHRIYLNIYKRLNNQDLYIKKYYINKIKKIPMDNIDYILVIKGSTLNNEIINVIKKKYSKAKWIMYQWDTVKNHYTHALSIEKNFDKIFSFDEVDCDTYNWIYRPLFYSIDRDCNISMKYDISYVCSFHSERYKLLKLLKNYIKKNNTVTFFDYLYTKKINFFYQKYVKRKNMGDFKYKKLNPFEINRLYDESKCIVDYTFPKQNGLTMRTIESIGHKCKLITNNKYILNSDFYDSQNIYVYDFDNFNIPTDFIYSPYKELNSEIYHKYSLLGWIEDVFELNSNESED